MQLLHLYFPCARCKLPWNAPACTCLHVAPDVCVRCPRCIFDALDHAAWQEERLELHELIAVTLHAISTGRVS